MEYVDCKDTDFKLLYKKLKPIDVKHYMYEALKVLLRPVAPFRLGSRFRELEGRDAPGHKAAQSAL